MRYQVIYADPPWQYRDKKRAGRTKCGAENHYDCLTVEQIKSLPVPLLAEENAVLFLWATFPLLPEALEVMDAWGFQYKTLGFSWIKTNRDGSLWHGVGAYAKSNCEVCLMGTRGRVGRLVRDEWGRQVVRPGVLSVRTNHISSVVLSPRLRHSEKPEEVRRRIDQLFGAVPRLELFARRHEAGWDAWGNEIKSTISLSLETTSDGS